MRTSVNLLTDISQRALVVGERFPGAGHLGSNKARYTIQIIPSNLVGRVSIEASLIVSPEEGDWFPVLLGGQPYVEFRGDRDSRGFTFRGNYVWLRAKLDRRYLLPVGASVDTLLPGGGILDRVLLVT